MNAVEIEAAISELADQPFDAEGFPYAFLEAFGNKATTIKRLKSGSSNASDKVLNPLFLDDLREQLKQAEDNPRKLLNLRKRLSTIRPLFIVDEVVEKIKDDAISKYRYDPKNVQLVSV